MNRESRMFPTEERLPDERAEAAKVATERHLASACTDLAVVAYHRATQCVTAQDGAIRVTDAATWERESDLFCELLTHYSALVRPGIQAACLPIVTIVTIVTIV